MTSKIQKILETIEKIKVYEYLLKLNILDNTPFDENAKKRVTVEFRQFIISKLEELINIENNTQNNILLYQANNIANNQSQESMPINRQESMPINRQESMPINRQEQKPINDDIFDFTLNETNSISNNSSNEVPENIDPIQFLKSYKPSEKIDDETQEEYDNFKKLSPHTQEQLRKKHNDAEERRRQNMNQMLFTYGNILQDPSGRKIFFNEIASRKNNEQDVGDLLLFLFEVCDRQKIPLELNEIPLEKEQIKKHLQVYKNYKKQRMKLGETFETIVPQSDTFNDQNMIDELLALPDNSPIITFDAHGEAQIVNAIDFNKSTNKNNIKNINNTASRNPSTGIIENQQNQHNSTSNNVETVYGPNNTNSSIHHPPPPESSNQSNSSNTNKNVSSNTKMAMQNNKYKQIYDPTRPPKPMPSIEEMNRIQQEQAEKYASALDQTLLNYILNKQY